MARPRKEGLDYFPHDTDAANDEKVEALRALYGNDGYAFFFILLERIYRAGGRLRVSDAETRQILARKVGVPLGHFDAMLATAISWGCFDPEIHAKDGILTSNGIQRRVKVVADKRSRMRDAYDSQGVSGGVSDAETQQKLTTEGRSRKASTSEFDRVSDAETTAEMRVSDAEMGAETGVSAEFQFRAKAKQSKEELSPGDLAKEADLASQEGSGEETCSPFGAPVQKDPDCFGQSSFRDQFPAAFQKLVHPYDTPPNLQRTVAALEEMCNRIQLGLNCRGDPAKFCRPLLAHALRSTADKKRACQKAREKFDPVAWFLVVFESEATERWSEWKEHCR